MVLVLPLLLGACTLELDPRPSILVIAVESLGFEAVPCESDMLHVDEWEGLRRLCDESVRFTHAFTPSLHVQATMASLLTGQYPIDHGVRNNGPNYLSGSWSTAPEVAVEGNYKTALVSTGPSLLRKSGLAQGFEYFEDNFSISREKLFRTIEESVALWSTWLQDSVGSRPFFSVIFWGQEQKFIDSTKNELDTSVSIGSERYLKRISDNLRALTTVLEKNKRWHNTYVFLLGMRGEVSLTKGRDPSIYNLNTENTQVALLVKPARQVRDSGLSWKIDKNVSLVDVGRTLFEILSRVPEGGPAVKDRGTVSLKSALYEPASPWPENRAILTEASGLNWQNMSSTRYALRSGQFLFINDKVPRVYNTQVDRNETNPLNVKDSVYTPMVQPLIALAKQWQLQVFNSPANMQIQKYNLSNQLWNGRLLAKESQSYISEYSKRWKNDREVRHWAIQKALEINDWEWVEKLGRHYRKASWIFLGKRNLQKPVRWRPGGCWRLFAVPRRRLIQEDISSCNDKMLVSLVQWLRSEEKVERASYFANFILHYKNYLLDREIAVLNYRGGEQWDLSSPLTEPALAELYLYLPENKKVFDFVSKVLKVP